MAGTDGLSGVRLKFGRGVRHLQEAIEAAHHFLLSNPVAVDVEELPDGAGYRTSVQVADAPPEVALAFGDAIQNFRAALDYMTRVLVEVHGLNPIDKGPGSTQFPIHGREPRAFAINPGVSDAALTIIEGCQPYHAEQPENHPLSRLQQISNRDKHRLLHVTAISGTYNAALIPLEAPESFALAADTPRYPIRLAEGRSQVIRPTDGFTGPARLGGMTSYTVVLGDSEEPWSEQLLLIGTEILDFVRDSVLRPLEQTILSTSTP